MSCTGHGWSGEEALREAVLTMLVVRHPLKFSVAAVAAYVRRDRYAEYSFERIEAALRFLRDLGLAESVPYFLGCTPLWRATAAGIAAHERQELPGSRFISCDAVLPKERAAMARVRAILLAPEEHAASLDEALRLLRQLMFGGGDQ